MYERKTYEVTITGPWDKNRSDAGLEIYIKDVGIIRALSRDDIEPEARMYISEVFDIPRNAFDIEIIETPSRRLLDLHIDTSDAELILDSLEYDKARQDNHEVIEAFNKLIGYIERTAGLTPVPRDRTESESDGHQQPRADLRRLPRTGGVRPGGRP
jgi:hypothetical protein